MMSFKSKFGRMLSRMTSSLRTRLIDLFCVESEMVRVRPLAFVSSRNPLARWPMVVNVERERRRAVNRAPSFCTAGCGLVCIRTRAALYLPRCTCP